MLLSLLLGHVSSSGEFLIVIGGYQNASYLDDVELVSLNPTLNPVPDCLSNLNSLPFPLAGAAGTADGGYAEDEGDCLALLTKLL